VDVYILAVNSRARDRKTQGPGVGRAFDVFIATPSRVVLAVVTVVVVVARSEAALFKRKEERKKKCKPKQQKSNNRASARRPLFSLLFSIRIYYFPFLLR
jgi:hypothetical protein